MEVAACDNRYNHTTHKHSLNPPRGACSYHSLSFSLHIHIFSFSLSRRRRHQIPAKRYRLAGKFSLISDTFHIFINIFD